MSTSSMAIVAIVTSLAACGGPPRPEPPTGKAEPAGPVGRVPLPEDLPGGDAACLAFTAAADGALFATSSHDRFAQGGEEGGTRIGFAMAEGVAPPIALDHAVKAEDAAAWGTERGAIDAKLATVSLVPCLDVASANTEEWSYAEGGKVQVLLVADPAPAVNRDQDEMNDVASTWQLKLAVDGGAPRTIAKLTSGPHDGTDHESIGAVYRNAAGSAIAVVIRNDDTGRSSQRIVVARTRR